MPKTKATVMVGTPVQIGSDLFHKFCLPAVREASTTLKATPQQMGQLYAGFISAAVGAMCADVGKEQALAWARQTLDMIESEDFTKFTPQKH